MKKLIIVLLAVLFAAVSLCSATSLYARPDLMKATINDYTLANGIFFDHSILLNDLAGPGKVVFEPENIALIDPAYGEVLVQSNGMFGFYPTEKKGTAMFYYTITDDKGAVSGRALVKIQMLRAC